jgi:hypothetical protein
MEGFRVATCKEVSCGAYLYGWVTKLLLGKGDEYYEKCLWDIRQMKLKYTMELREDGFSYLTFEPGQACFNSRIAPHKKRKESARELFYKKDLITGEIYKFQRPCDWVDSSAEHYSKLSDTVQRG